MGEAARNLFSDAQAMLKKIIDEKWVTAKAVVGFWPANAVGDDILLFRDEGRMTPLATLHTLRQQLARREGRSNLALADFVAPVESGVHDYVGGFAVTAGIGEEERTAAFKAANDDYSAILLKALCDRLAEAFAERMHQRVRKEFWGYADDEGLSNEDLIAEKYRGIRRARLSGSARPHGEGHALHPSGRHRQDRAGAHESFAMWPGAAVSGLYFAHPESAYFGVGRIERDQVEDYAARKGWTVEQAERWLAPILNYEPTRRAAAE